MATLLEDLDELTLKCRDEKTRNYISEAVASYKVGAFRSAIVATWIAVCFDVIEKFRELALAGDKEAEKQVHEIDETRRTGDLGRALKFEKTLLDLAKNQFELISPLEYLDLERLQSDRNRCAHPSLTSDDQAYSPSAELVRLHIHSAVTHLLQHPPVQGKYALDRLLREIDSDYFPTSSKDAKVAFSSGPLRRPRESLTRNLVFVLAKTLLNEKVKWKRARRIAAALNAISQLHPMQYSKAFSEKLSVMFRAVSDEDLMQSVQFLRFVPDSWQYLGVDIHQRLKNYVLDLPKEDLDEIDFLLEYPPLVDQARRRVKKATKKELIGTIFFTLPNEVADRYVDIYLNSSSFDEANEWAKQMLMNIEDFSTEQVKKILAGASENGQIRGSFQIGALINGFRAKSKLPAEDFDALLVDLNLEEHLVKSD